MGRILDALNWSGSGATLSMFVVSRIDAALDPSALSLEPAPTRTLTYALEDEDNVLSGRRVVEYDLIFPEVPPHLDVVLAKCLHAAEASGADVAWFAFEGSFDFRYLLSQETANQVYAVIDAEGIALASDATISTKAWADRIVRAGERTRGYPASRSGA